ncbi:TPA: hypothetical protein EYP83_01345 [Candidatus Geothermarchaeota archaeon]|nr:hypothetical protein [Candidatus Geothermarchaeota archaeon]HIQ12819.1 hypothetical protein [Thermoprotei archaeon]
MAGGRLRLTIYFTGGLIAILLIIHLSLYSFWLVEGGYYTNMDWSNVSNRMRSLTWDIFYIILLSAVLLHSYSGIKGILYEYITGDRGRRIVDIVTTIIWVVALIYGLIPIMAG